MTIKDTLGTTTGKTNFVPKGWGYELHIHNGSDYCGKLLHFVSGRRCSAHYHKLKTETFFLHKGKMDIFFFDGAEHLEELLQKERESFKAMSAARKLDLEALSNAVVRHIDYKIHDYMERVTLTQGMKFEVPVGRVHQMIALEDSELFEFSTQDFPEDSIRLLKGD